MAAIDRLDEVKREVSHAARELFVAADEKAWNMPLAGAITTRLTTAVKGRHGVLPQLWKTATQHVQTHIAHKRRVEPQSPGLPPPLPNRDAALKPDGGTGGRCYSGRTVCALWWTILRTAVTSQRAPIIGQRLDAGSSVLLNLAIRTHDVGVWWADAARWLVRICDAGDTAPR